MIKILFLASNPDDTSSLKLDEEMRSITNKIRASDYRDVLEVVSRWAVRPDDLLQALNEHKPQIVHFSGHGSAEGEIVLMDDRRQVKPVSAAALKMLFTTMKDNIRVVVLNACFSRTQAQAITEIIDCAVGMSTAIGDEAAIAFAASFYRAIGFGRSIQEAFDQGRTALLLEGIPEESTPELLFRRGVDPSQLHLIDTVSKGVDPSLLYYNNKHTKSMASEVRKSDECDLLRIDDIFVQKEDRQIKLDVRLRNSGDSVVNLTKADLHVLDESTSIGWYSASASYDLIIEDEHNVLPVAHVLQPNEVDSFIIRLGFNTSSTFTAELVLYYNNKCMVVSKPFRFSS